MLWGNPLLQIALPRIRKNLCPAFPWLMKLSPFLAPEGERSPELSSGSKVWRALQEEVLQGQQVDDMYQMSAQNETDV